jgi:hypothetical protein
VFVEIRAGQKLHDQAQLAALAAVDVEHLHRGRTLQGAERLLLADHALGRLRIARGLGRQHLDRDLPVHPAVASAVHDALTAAPEHTQALVALIHDVTGAKRRVSHAQTLTRPDVRRRRSSASLQLESQKLSYRFQVALSARPREGG